MTWICAYCGVENYQDDRIGFREPFCRICAHEKISPAKLKEKKERKLSALVKERERVIGRIQGIRDHIWSINDEILELEQDRDKLKEELKDTRAEVCPRDLEISEWESIEIFTEEKSRAFIAAHDAKQKKLIEVKA